MLILPKAAGFSDEAWEEVELGAMREVVGLYGKTFHFWEIDAGHDIPLGMLFLLVVIFKIYVFELFLRRGFIPPVVFIYLLRIYVLGVN